MKKLKRMLALLMVMALTVCLSANVTWAAKSKKQQTADNMNLDVIFAIDGSGSMKQSDALNLRLRSGSLFTELAASNTARAGYVQFSNKILESAGLTDLSDQGSKENFKNQLLNLKDSVKGSWDTDISLGLTEAVRLLKEGGSFGNDRHPVIILLSDGNTDLPEGPRTVEESNAELGATLDEAKKLGVPVYAIGLNWDGKLDVEAMKKIAKSTSGKAYDITTATAFNECMQRIFGTVADGDNKILEPEFVNGRYETNFVIDNKSVLTANIVVLTDKGVSDPKLTNPDGEDVPLDEANGVLVSADTNNPSTYTILKIMYPKQGVWKISVKGEAEDAVKISLLTTYDINFVISGEKDAVAGQDVKLKGSLVREKETIKDADLLKEASAVCTIIDSDGHEVVKDAKMNYDAKKCIFNYTANLPKSGNYYVTAQLEGKDGSFSKKSSQYTLSLERVPLKVSGSVSESMWCSPIKTKAVFSLGEYVTSCESLAELTCIAEEKPDRLASVSYNKDTGEVTLTPEKTGKGFIKLIIEDGHGQSKELSVKLTVRPSWIWFAAAAVLILLLVIILLVVHAKTKPLLTDAVTVELVMPQMLQGMTPAPVTLSMPAKTSQVILGRLLQNDRMAQSTLSGPIMQANLMPLIENVKLTAGKGGKIFVKILPKIQGNVVINNRAVDPKKGETCSLIKGERLSIQFSMDNRNISTLTLIIGEGGGWGPEPSPWVNGPFGGGIGNDPFGGDGNYGSPFGGGSGNDPFGGSGNNPFGSGAGNNPFGGSTDGFGGNAGRDFGGNAGGDFGGNAGGDFGGNAGGGFGGNAGGGFGGNTGGDFGGNTGGDFGGNAGGDFGGNIPGGFDGGNSNDDFGGEYNNNGFNFGEESPDGQSDSDDNAYGGFF